MNDIGIRIQNIRKAKGLTQAQLADTMQISRATVAQYESGKRKPKKETVARFADALGVPAGVLYPIDDKITQAKCSVENLLWAKETVACDHGEPWDISIYNHEREITILDIASLYNVDPQILFAYIPQRTENEYSDGSTRLESSAKEKAWDSFSQLPPEGTVQAINAFISCLWERWHYKTIPVFEDLLYILDKDETLAKMVVDKLEALVVAQKHPEFDKDPTQK